MNPALDTRTAGQRKADEYNWAKPKYRAMTRVTAPAPRKPRWYEIPHEGALIGGMALVAGLIYGAGLLGLLP